MAGGCPLNTAHLQGPAPLKIAIGGTDLGVEEDMFAAPIGITGQHVPLRIGAGRARQLLRDVAGVKGERAAIPAVARTAAIHTQHKSKTVIFVGDQLSIT